MSKLYAEAAKKRPQRVEDTKKSWGNEGASSPWRPSAEAPIFRPASTLTTQASVSASKTAPSQAKEHVNAPKTTNNQSSQTQKVSKKRKPTLQTTSIGDLIPKSIQAKTKVAASKGPPSPPRQQPCRKQAQNGLDSSAFPALSASFPALPIAAKKPKPAPPPHTTAQAVKKKKKSTSQANTIAKPASRQTSPKAKPSKAVARNSTAMGFTKKSLSPGSNRTELGAEHDLLRLMQEGKMAVTSKGRQRIRPRKKKFSALKKKVLEERLQKWRKLHPEEASENHGDDQAFVICVYGYVSQEELEDDDEYEEIVSNLHDMANRIGRVKRVFVPQSIENWTCGKWPSFVEFEEAKNVEAAISVWDGLLVGGETLEARSLPSTRDLPIEESEWRDWCLTT